MTTVRRVGPADLAAAVAVLVESHLDYVWERWALPGADRRRHLEALFAADLRLLALPRGEVWMTGDGASVAVWMPAATSGELPTAAGAELEAVASAAFGDRLAVVDEVDGLIRRVRPPADWYLATMGTRPEAQGRGLGTAVLGPRLAALDAAGERATLETSDAGNVRFYERLGFEVAAVVDALPHGAPATWVMQRHVSTPHGATPHR